MTVIDALKQILVSTIDPDARLILTEAVAIMEEQRGQYRPGFMPLLRERLAKKGYKLDRKTVSRIIRDTTTKKNQIHAASSS